MQISSIALLFAVIFVASVTSRSYRKARALGPPIETGPIVVGPPIGFQLCGKVGASCSADNDCCSKDCDSGKCCGLSGDKGCQLGQGYDHAGGCCLKHHCQWSDQAKNITECWETIY